jgi:hypothetical protein
MNKRKKSVLVCLLLFLLIALGFGIFLFPDEKPIIFDRADTNPEKDLPERPAIASSDTITTDSPSLNQSAVKKGEAENKESSNEEDSDKYVSYPEELVALLGIDMEKLIEEREAFKNTIIHVEWMDRVNEILKDLDPEKKKAIIKNHTSLLYIKDKLNEAYLSGKIDYETFKKSIADLMKWHQRTYEAILSGEEYKALFEIDPELVDDTIDALIEQTPEYSFILNQEMAVEDVKEKVQGYKLEEVNTHFKRMLLDRETLGKKINSGEITLEQAREALSQSEHAFIAKCKEILTEDEINIIFGSVTALETGATDTKPPAVLGNTDEIELGFKIENEKTSIKDVQDKIDQNKIEDLKFFYQQRAQEREELIKKLDAGEITPEELENISSEMDAVFEENCRSTLTNEEYQLIFGAPDGKEPDKVPAQETEKQSTEQEASQESVNEE